MTYAKPSQKKAKRRPELCLNPVLQDFLQSLGQYSFIDSQSLEKKIKQMQQFHDNFTIMALKKNTPPQVKLSNKTIKSSENKEDETNESMQHTSVVQELFEKQPDTQNTPDQSNNQPNNKLSEETSTDKLEKASTQHADKGNKQSESQFNNLPNQQSEKN
jgi:hypothetical protein